MAPPGSSWSLEQRASPSPQAAEPTSLVLCCSVAGYYMPAMGTGNPEANYAKQASCIPCPVRMALAPF